MKNKFEHGGNIHHFLRTRETNMPILDFSANINPLGLSDTVNQSIHNSISNVVHYPDPDCYQLKQTIANFYQLKVENLIIGNGAVELLYLLCHVIRPRHSLILAPSFSEYERSAKAANSSIHYLFLSEEDDFKINMNQLIKQLVSMEILFIGNPNNPTGNLLSTSEIRQILVAAKQENCYVVVDESFIDFIERDEQYTSRYLLNEFDNLILLQSLTKFYAIPGLRLGFAAMNEKLIQRLYLAKDPWNVNLLAQSAGVAGLQDIEYQQKSKRFISDNLLIFYRKLAMIKGLKIYQPTVNFILIKLLNSGMNAQALKAILMTENILIRDCSNYPGLNDSFIRIAVKSCSENNILLKNLNAIFGAELG